VITGLRRSLIWSYLELRYRSWWKLRRRADRGNGQKAEATLSRRPLGFIEVNGAFYSRFDPLDAQGSEERSQLAHPYTLRRAQELGAAVHFDSKRQYAISLTLSITKQLVEDEFRDRTDVGITIQTYLRDHGEQDVRI